MNMAIQRFFGVKAPPSSDSSRGQGRLTLGQLRESLQILLHDCDDMQSQRVIYKINIARTPADLWLLRSDLLQCISRVHNQAEAAQRINSIVEGFAGWMPSSQLTRI